MAGEIKLQGENDVVGEKVEKTPKVEFFKEKVSKENEKRSSPKKPLIKDEVHISFKPKKIFKGIFIILLLAVVFFAGRWSADVSQLDSLDFFQSDSVSGAVVADTGTVEETIEVETAPTEAEEQQETTEEKIEEPEEVEEEIITEYNNVEFTFDDVKIDWKETWGKVTYAGFTIKNNEAGTIKPSKVVMTMEKYERTEREIPLPPSAQTVKSTETLSKMLLIPHGFSYSRVTLDSLDDVKVTLTLYDEAGKEIASASKGFNLQG